MFTSIACVVLVIALLSVYTHAFSAGSSLALRKGAGLLTMEVISAFALISVWLAPNTTSSQALAYAHATIFTLALISVWRSPNTTSSQLLLTQMHECTTFYTQYIPSGLSKTQWAALKAKEKADADAKKNGSLGASRFKSRR
jgi:hypothetical protein